MSDVGFAIPTQAYSSIVKRFVFWPTQTEQCFCCSFLWFNSVRYGGYAVMPLTPCKIMSKFSLNMLRLRYPWLKLTCSRRRSDIFKCLYFPKVSSSDSLPCLGSKYVLLTSKFIARPAKQMFRRLPRIMWILCHVKMKEAIRVPQCCKTGQER